MVERNDSAGRLEGLDELNQKPSLLWDRSAHTHLHVTRSPSMNQHHYSLVSSRHVSLRAPAS